MIFALRNTALIAVSLFGLSLATWGQSCSNASLTGPYGFAGTGTNASGSPVALAGVYNADGKGKLAGTRTASVNGVIFLNVPISGTYTINSNCNGTAQITPKGESTENYNLTVASAGGRVFSLETDTGSILPVYSRAVEETSCSTTGTSGTFGFAGSGSVIGVGNLANGGQVTLDGAGHLTGTESISIAGQISSDVAFTGAYKVNKNCSGTATVKVKGKATVHLTFVLVRQLQSIFFVETDANTVIAGWDRE
jgi:hypothetical protein